tara:strand:- start:436 stop:624 length:189 start_codon:yes stop_codon:yes gene_type:complete
MKSGSKWLKMVLSGARNKYIKIFSKLNFTQKIEQNKSNQNKSHLTEIEQNKNKRNKFGFPII